MGNVLGIPPQVLMDALMIVIDDNTHAPSPVVHCDPGSVLFYSKWDAEDEIWSACQPVDTSKSLDWVCAEVEAGYGNSYPDSHHGCGPANKIRGTILYCVCSQARDTNGIRVYNYYQSDGKDFCKGCVDDHGKKPPCPACGEVH
jgi:hypothetical protein